MYYLERQGFDKIYRLDPKKDKFLIGRSAASDIQFTSTFVSRKHCEIQRIPPYGRLIIKNCTTTNSTHVDGEELNNEKDNDVAELRVGAMIGLGVPLNIYEERLSDDRFVYLKVCQETINVSQEIQELSSSHVLNQSKASTVTANISQEEIDISGSENASRNDDIEIVYSSPIIDKEILPYCAKKEVPLFPDITSSGPTHDGRPSSSQDGISYQKNESEAFSRKQLMKDGEFVNRSPLPNFAASSHSPNRLQKELKENYIPQKFKRELDGSSPNVEITYKVNSNDTNLRDNSSICDATLVTEDNVFIRECKLEISGQLEDELEKEIEYEHINGVRILQPFMPKSIKKELVSEFKIPIPVKIELKAPDVSNENVSEPTDNVIILSDSSDEEDEIPCNQQLQGENVSDRENHEYSESNFIKKRISNIDSGPPHKRLKQDYDSSHLESAYESKISRDAMASASDNLFGFSETTKCMKKEPTKTLIASLEIENREEENPSTHLENKFQMKNCSIQLDRIPESNMRNLIEFSTSNCNTVGSSEKVILKPNQNAFEKNHIISDSESENGHIECKSDSEMSVDDTTEDDGKETIQNLNLSLENLNIDEQENKSNNDVEKSSTYEVDVSKVKKEPLEMARLRSFFGDESSDEDEDDYHQITYSQVDDVILVSSDDESSFIDEHANASLENVSFGPLPPPEIDVKHEEDDEDEDEDYLPDLLKCDKENIFTFGRNKSFDSHLQDREDSEKEFWPVLSEGFFDDEEEYDQLEMTEVESKKETEDDNKQKFEADSKQKIEFDRKQKIEVDRKQKIEVDRKQKIEVDRKQKIEEDKKQKIEEDKKQKIEVDKKQKIEVNRKQKIEVDRKQKIDEAMKQKIDEDVNKKTEVDKKTKIEVDRKRKAAGRKSKTEVDRERKMDREKKIEVERKKKTEVEREKKIEMDRKRKTVIEENKKTDKEKQMRTDTEVKRKTHIEKTTEVEHKKITELEKKKEMQTSAETRKTDTPPKDLQSIISKISNRHIAKSKFTEPKLPPMRTKTDEIPKKRGRARRIENEEIASKSSRLIEETTDNDTHEYPKCQDEALKYDDTSVLRNNKCSPSPSIPRKRHRKSPDIRKTLQKTHNFDIYKGKPDKKRYHLIDRSLKEQERLDLQEASSNNLKENISILPKNKESVAPVMKGIAKISSKSRSEKLTEINLFLEPTKAKPKAHGSFKIPKMRKSDTKNKVNQVVKSPPHSILISRPVTNDDQQPSTSNASNVPEIPNDAQDVIMKEPLNPFALEPKGILKICESKKNPYKKVNRVHFPPRNEDLVAIRPISPRQNKNCSGPDQVSHSEKYFGQSILKSAVTDPLEYILKICNWNWDWLKTYQTAKKSQKSPALPTLCENSVLPTFTIYKSLNDYQQVFSNLLYYEAWESIYRDWEQHIENIAFFPCEIDVREEKFLGEDKTIKYYKVKALSFITIEMSRHGQHPTIGSLIAMRHKRDNNKAVYTFGYVQGFSKRNGSCVSENLKRLSPQGANIVIIFEIIFSKKHIESDFKPGMTASFCNVCYFRPTYRAFECLFHLNRSPLLPTILNPGDIRVFESKGCHKNYLVTQLPMNELQMKSIVEVSSKCVSEFSKPNLSLIHGPPGTGKTRVIAALIVQINLMFKNSEHSSNRRILLCAPSNAAVDELVLRLVQLKKLGIFLNIVRVGVKQSIHPDVGEYSFDVKVKKEFEKRQFPNDDKIKAELKKKKEFCDKAANELQKARADKNSDSGKIKQLERRLHELMRSLKSFENNCKFQLNKHESDKLFNDCRRKVLMTAEIIAATLTCCLSGSVQEVFKKEKNSFACCIVDEAGQCKESEIWFPLQLGIKKLILVGDHKQLPATALSQLCQGKNLHQSLFERVYHHVGIEKCRMDVIHSLNIQYRMHEDILAWPSMHFYNNDLVTGEDITKKMTHALSPYLILDVKSGGEEERNTGEISNIREALMIRALIESQEEYLQGLSIGVLTPYTTQKMLIIKTLSHLVSKYKIAVSTVDSFQGQEKDIIYCSFVRSNSSKKIGFVSDRHRLNVALTRARKSCFVIGDLKSLQWNGDWKSLIKDAQCRNLIRTIPQTMNLTDKNTLLQMTLKNK